MRYFILQMHPFFQERFRLNGWQEQINTKWICFENFYKIPRRCILTVALGENVPFPDITTVPFLLISSLMMDMVKMYGSSVYKRDVIVINEQEQKIRQYHLVLLESVERGHIMWEESNIFNLVVEGKREIVVSQDFAESILRRGVLGITLKEINNRKE